MFVNYKLPNVAQVHTASGASFTFIPGVNQIDSTLWKQLLENKHFKNDVDAKHYVVEINDDQSVDDEDDDDLDQGGDDDDGEDNTPTPPPQNSKPASKPAGETKPQAESGPLTKMASAVSSAVSSAFSGASDDTTSRVISETYDIKTLKEMRRSETRRAVLDKIDAQILRLQEERRSNRGRVNTEEEA
jgi:hypothetical protein